MTRSRIPFLVCRTLMIATLAALTASTLAFAAVPLLAAPGEQAFLSDLRWQRATGGWVTPGIDPAPERDRDLWSSTLSVGGVEFARGIAAFPASDISYNLDGSWALLRGAVGLQDWTPAPGDTARFHVFVDEVLVWESGVLRRGDAPVPFEVPVAGGRSLRLALSPGAPGDPGGEGVWGDLRLIAASPDLWEPARARLDALLAAWLGKRSAQGAVAQSSAEAAGDVLRQVLARAGLPDRPAAVWNGVDETTGSHIIANAAIAVVVSADLQVQGMSVLTLPDRTPVLLRVIPALLTQDGARHPLLTRGMPSVPAAVAFRADPGSGGTLEVGYATAAGAVRLLVALDDRGRAFTYQLAPEGVPPSSVGGLAFFDAEQPATLIVPGAAAIEYLTDTNMLRHGVISDDGVARWETVGTGKPVLVRPEGAPHGLLFGMIDPVEVPGRVDFQRQPGAPDVALGFRQPVRGGIASATAPRLYVEVVPPVADWRVFAGYRQALAQRYPPRPLPAWFRNQWLSWYVSYMDINEAYLLQQTGLLTHHFGDLGPWHIIVDAGWYLAEGRPGSDWRHVDPDKFPSGLRAFTDAVHLLGVNVVLFFSTPYVDTYVNEGNWLAMISYIQQHPDWLVPLPPQGDVQRYLFNYQHPGLRADMDDLVQRFFWDYGVDGLKLDGLGWGEGELRDLTARGVWQPQDAALGRGQTLDIYRQVAEAATRAAGPDAYIESGWVTPPFAAPYAQTFRYGDEYPAWRSDYPFPGLLDHLDYALFQTLALGQRANIGAVYGDPRDRIGTQWLDAALATGAQVALSFDLGRLTPDLLAAYRGRLAALHPFTGTTTVSPGWQPAAVATDQGERVYLAQINRAGEEQVLTTPLAGLGLAPGPWTGYQPDTDRALLVEATLESAVPGDSLLLTVLRATVGVLWSTSGVTLAAQPEGALVFAVTGPREAAGLVVAATPLPTSVTFDGQRLLRDGDVEDEANAWWSYDAATGVLRVYYQHTTGVVHHLEVAFHPAP